MPESIAWRIECVLRGMGKRNKGIAKVDRVREKEEKEEG